MESITQETQDILQLLKYTLPTNISVTIVPFEHMQIAQITIKTFLIYLDIFEFRNYGILKNIHCHMESLFNPRNNI